MFVSDSKYKSLQAACTRRLGSNVLRWPTDKQTHSHAQNGLECTVKIDIWSPVVREGEEGGGLQKIGIGNSVCLM